MARIQTQEKARKNIPSHLRSLLRSFFKNRNEAVLVHFKMAKQ